MCKTSLLLYCLMGFRNTLSDQCVLLQFDLNTTSVQPSELKMKVFSSHMLSLI